MNPTVRLFQDFQRIYGICPCCGDAFRLSNASLHYATRPPRTPWDDLEDQIVSLERAEERLDADSDRLREKAKQDGRKEMARRLRGLTKFFRSQRIDLHDMKLLFHPVDYVVFRGMSSDDCRSIEFLDCEPTSASHEKLQKSIERTIRAGNYSWTTMRIEDSGRVRFV